MLLLPTFNATLQPCTVGPAAFTAHELGHFCGRCQRVVQDFSLSPNPTADLAAARAASPDGRVCGRFSRAQTTAPPPLTQRLRWFLVALVLVLGQGLTAHEALAQVRRAVGVPTHRPASKSKRKPDANANLTTQTVVNGDVADGLVGGEPGDSSLAPGNRVFTYVQQMPSFRGGNNGELVTYLQQQVQQFAATIAGRVVGRAFVSFTVGKDGVVRNVRIVKSLQPLVDAEVVRIVRALTGFAPGKQNGQVVAVSLTLPITLIPK